MTPGHEKARSALGQPGLVFHVEHSEIKTNPVVHLVVVVGVVVAAVGFREEEVDSTSVRELQLVAEAEAGGGTGFEEFLQPTDEAFDVYLRDLADSVEEEVQVLAVSILVEDATGEGDVAAEFGAFDFDLPDERDCLFQCPGHSLVPQIGQ